MVDALVSGTSVRDDVQVRVLSWALNQEAGFKTENQASFFLGGGGVDILGDELSAGQKHCPGKHKKHGCSKTKKHLQHRRKCFLKYFLWGSNPGPSD